jgi:desulfoferrodoxin (superoxide reductase-like protein)
MAMPTSANRRDFLLNTSLATATLVLPQGLLGCSEEDAPAVEVVPEFEEVADALEQNNKCCWTGNPGEVGSPPVGAHLPLIEISEVSGRLRATVSTLGDEYGVGEMRPHPMLPEHYIAVMYVRNQDNIVVGFRDFGQSAIKLSAVNSDPTFYFDVPAGTKWLRAFAYCTLHQHWKGAQVDV